MPTNPDYEPTPEREPPNWFVLPIAMAILVTIVVAYRFSCSSY